MILQTYILNLVVLSLENKWTSYRDKDDQCSLKSEKVNSKGVKWIVKG